MNCPFTLQLGVYSLDRLKAADRAAVDRHLPTCDQCQAELKDLQALLPLLSAARASGVDVSGARREPSTVLLQRTLRAAAARRVRRTRRLLAAAAAVLAIAAAIGIAVGSSRPAAPPPVTQIAGPAATKTTIIAAPDGARVDLTLTGLPARSACRLVIHARNGYRETVSSWRVYYTGPVEVHARTTIHTEDITWLDIVDDSDHSLLLVAASTLDKRVR